MPSSTNHGTGREALQRPDARASGKKPSGMLEAFLKLPVEKDPWHPQEARLKRMASLIAEVDTILSWLEDACQE
ncbi:hypothetical protein RBB50_002658 [Rhinocladiella similis]